VEHTVASTARGRTTRRRVVSAAAELMLTNGVAATSVDDVLRRSHASKSQLYHYFTDRQDLVLAVTQHACSRVLAAQQQLARIADWDDLAACFDRIVDSRSNRVTRLGCPLGTLAGELATTDEPARKMLATAFTAWQRQLGDGLARLQRHGLLDADADLDHLATATLASLQGGLLLAKTTGSREPLRIALDAAFRHLRSFAAELETPAPQGSPTTRQRTSSAPETERRSPSKKPSARTPDRRAQTLRSGAAESAE
jgi:AcrR family transcriptional regulator